MRYVVFDLETGGLEPQHPNIQIGAVACEFPGWNILDRFEQKIAFDIETADAESLKLNSFDPAGWTDAVEEVVALRRFSNFTENYRDVRMVSKRTGNPYYIAQLVGKNSASFDGPRLKDAYQRHDLFLPGTMRSLDVEQLALWWFLEHPNPPENYKLDTLCAYFDIELEAHDALGDAVGTALLLQRLYPRRRSARNGDR